MPGFLGNQAADLLEEVMERKDIDPGELNERVGDTLDLINEFAPIVKSIHETSQKMEGDVNNLRDDIDSLKGNMDRLEESSQEFSGSSDDMVESMDNLAESLDKFRDLVQDVEEGDVEV